MTQVRTRSMRYSQTELLTRYRGVRARSREIFDLIAEEAYYCQPIALRHPIVFYEGHLPAFSCNTLLKSALGRPGIDRRFEVLFARGIDPDEAGRAPSPRSSETVQWPSREEVH